VHPFAAWESFYVIVGSSAAALTGLQFVVIVLSTEVNAQANVHTTSAFGTPTIVHFCATLFISAMLSTPWRALTSVSVILAATGIFGVVYCIVVLLRARRQDGYEPVFEDWLWHFGLPFVAYATLLVAALTLVHHETDSPFAIAATALLLLFVGIHNAWDSVTFIVMRESKHKAATSMAGTASAPNDGKPVAAPAQDSATSKPVAQ
jgi:hypothetical protein